MAVDAAGRDPLFFVNDTVQMTSANPVGDPVVITGRVVDSAYGTAKQIQMRWRGSLARNAGEMSPRFFYKIQGDGFDPKRAYREESLQAVA